MSVEKKKCIECQSYEKLKLFDDLNVKFHHYCNAMQKPIALIHECKIKEKKEDKNYLNYLFQFY